MYAGKHWVEDAFASAFTETDLLVEPLVKVTVHFPPFSAALIISATTKTAFAFWSKSNSIKLNFAAAAVGAAEVDSEGVGDGDESLAEGDCEVDGFWSVPQFG
jgi:hypothetical protein